jgi:hypothetical protein
MCYFIKKISAEGCLAGILKSVLLSFYAEEMFTPPQTTKVQNNNDKIFHLAHLTTYTKKPTHTHLVLLYRTLILICGWNNNSLYTSIATTATPPPPKILQKQ